MGRRIGFGFIGIAVLAFAGLGAVQITDTVKRDLPKKKTLMVKKVSKKIEMKRMMKKQKMEGITLKKIHIGDNLPSPFVADKRFPKDAPWDAAVNASSANPNNDLKVTREVSDPAHIYLAWTDYPLDDHSCNIAMSTDSGQTWSVWAYGAGAGTDIDNACIDVDDQGYIRVWCTYGAVKDIVWLETYEAAPDYNNPDSVDGWFWYGAGEAEYYYEMESISIGQEMSNNFLEVIGRHQHPPGDTSAFELWWRDDNTAGWSYYNLGNSLEFPQTCPTVGIMESGGNTFLLSCCQEDSAGYSNVNWWIDTLGSGSFWGWSTYYLEGTRCPSAFGSGQYGYLAYEIDTASSGEEWEIYFTQTTDAGQNWAGISAIAEEAGVSERHPSIYANGNDVGVAYVRDGNNTNFIESVDNGLSWTATEVASDNNTTYDTDRSLGLLWAGAFWYAAWVDTRNGASNSDVYTARKALGEPDISHSPDSVIIDFTAKGPSLNYIEIERYPIIVGGLNDLISKASSTEKVRINISMKTQPNWSSVYESYIKKLPKLERRLYVTRELKKLANQDQAEVLSFLRNMESQGKAEGIVSLWINNTVAAQVTPDVIYKLAEMEGVCQIYRDDIKAKPIDMPRTVGVEEPATIKGGKAISWHVIKINADDVWAEGDSGQGVVYGHIGCGADYTHSDLSDHLWDGSGYGYPNHGYDWEGGDNDPIEDAASESHGTNVAGIVSGDGSAGTQTGVAPAAEWMGLKIAYLTHYNQAVEFGLDYGADVFGTSVGWDYSIGAADYENYKNSHRASYAGIYAAGLVIIGAAGNGDGGGGHYSVPHDIGCAECTPAPWYHPNGGANASIAVGATDESDAIAYFSSYGPAEWDNGTYNDYPYSPQPGLMKPDVAAPGVNLTSCGDGGGYDGGCNGTSFAQPCVCGAVCLMLCKSPGLTPENIDSLLETTAVDLGAVGRDNNYGAGRINAYQAWASCTPYKSSGFYVKNSAVATGILSVSEITWAKSWVKNILPQSFTVPIGDSNLVTVWADSSGVAASDFDWMGVVSNDPDDSPHNVKVVILIGSGGDKCPPKPTTVDTVKNIGSDVNLFWTAVTQDTTGAEETMDKYVIYRNTVPSGIFPSEWDSIGTQPWTATSHADFGAVDSFKSFYYIVQARDAAGNASKKSGNMGYKEYYTLQNQWNLVSLPYHSYSTGIESLGASITNCEAIVSPDYKATAYDAIFEWVGHYINNGGDPAWIKMSAEDSANLIGTNDPNSGFSFLADEIAWFSLPYNYDAVAYPDGAVLAESLFNAGIRNEVKDDTLFKYDPTYGDGYRYVYKKPSGWDYNGTWDGVLAKGDAYGVRPQTNPVLSWTPQVYSNTGAKGLSSPPDLWKPIVFKQRPKFTPPIGKEFIARKDTKGGGALLPKGPAPKFNPHIMKGYVNSQGTAYLADSILTNIENLNFETYLKDSVANAITKATANDTIIQHDPQDTALWQCEINDLDWAVGDSIITIVTFSYGDTSQINKGYYRALRTTITSEDVQVCATGDFIEIPSIITTEDHGNYNTVIWNKASSPIMGYRIYRSVNFADIDSFKPLGHALGGINDTTYDDSDGSGVTEGDSVYYAVTVVVDTYTVAKATGYRPDPPDPPLGGGSGQQDAPLGVQEQQPVIPRVFALKQNMPNPFANNTVILYDIPAKVGQETNVQIKIYDVAGKLVHTLVDANKIPGHHSVEWNACDDRGNKLSSGIYFYRITTAEFKKTKKLILLR